MGCLRSTWAGWFYVAFMPGVVVPGAGDQWDADVLTCWSPGSAAESRTLSSRPVDNELPRRSGRATVVRDMAVIAHRYGYALAHGVGALLRAEQITHRCDEPLCQERSHVSRDEQLEPSRVLAAALTGMVKEPDCGHEH